MRVLGWRFTWAFGLGTLLFLETLLLFSPLLLGFFVPSLREPGMLGITGLDILLDIAILIALAIDVVGLITGFVVAGYAPRALEKRQERAQLWRRLLKRSAIWCLIGVFCSPFCLLGTALITPNNYPLGLFGPPLITFVGTIVQLRQVL